LAPLFFCRLASDEEHDDEDEDEDEDDDNDEEAQQEGGRGAGSEGCSPWGPMDDVGGRGMSARGGPSMSPVDKQRQTTRAVNGVFFLRNLFAYGLFSAVAERLTWKGLGQQHRWIPALHHSRVPKVLKLEREALQRAVPVAGSTRAAKAVLVDVLRQRGAEGRLLGRRVVRCGVWGQRLKKRGHRLRFELVYKYSLGFLSTLD